MFLTRIKRGAIRTGILVTARAERLALSYKRITPSSAHMRTLAVSLTAAYTAVLPVLPLRAQAAGPRQTGPLTEDSAEPPSTNPGLSPVSLRSIRAEAQVTGSLSVTPDRLADISVGTSRQTAFEQQQEAAHQAELQKLADEQKAAKIAAAKRAKVVAVSYSGGSVQQAVHDAVVATFGESQWSAMYTIIQRESGFNPSSYNSRSGACGLFQAHPCSKMGSMDVASQIQWGIGYIKSRYGTPEAALAFHNVRGWY